MNTSNNNTSRLFRSSPILSVSLLCALLPACIQEVTDDDDNGIDTGNAVEVQAPPTAEAFQAMSQDARGAFTQEFDVDPSAWSSLQGAQGSSLFFYPNSFLDADGNPAVGPVQVELIEIFDKGSMLVTDMPSVGQLPTGEKALLVSGGEHYVGATQNGEDLRLHGTFSLNTPADNTGGLDEDMRLFRADGDGDAWVEEEDEKALRIGDADGGGAGYMALSGEFGWTNIDRWYSDSRPKTTIHISVPDGWDDTNSVVYLSYDGESNALARMDTYDDSTGLFSEHYGLIPIGLDVHIIFVTELDGEWSYAIQGTTITDGHLTEFTSAESLIETDTDGLVQAINVLP
jgi:hypothetical protein